MTALLLTIPTIATAHGCPAHGAVVLTVGDFYVTASGAIYEEANTFDGLQTTGGVCGGDGRDVFSYEADRRVA